MKLWVLVFVFNVYPSNFTRDEAKKNTPHVSSAIVEGIFRLESECAKEKEASMERAKKLLKSDFSEIGKYYCLETEIGME